MVCVPRVTALENHFNASEHLSRTPGIDHLAALHLDFDSEVTFYSGNWINYDTLAHKIPPFS
jgi:hypothetical protein